MAATAAATLALASCSKDDSPAEPVMDGEIKIVTTIASNSGDAIDSRATFEPDGSGTFETGDAFNLRATGSLGIPGGYPYEIGTTTYTWSDFEVFGDEDALTFAGYYPLDASLNGDKFSVVTSPNPDLLVAPSVTVSKGDVVNLAFRHAMHRLVVKLTSNVLTAAELSAATVQLSRWLKTEALVDFATATAFTTGSNVYPTAPKQTGATCEFILVPQDLAADKYNDRITITAGGKEWVYTLPATIPGNDDATPRRLQGEKTLTVNLAINSTAGRSTTLQTRGTSAADEALTLECTGIEVTGR